MSIPFINWNGIAGNPVNWLVIPTLALFGLIFAALLSAPLRNQSAQ